MSTQTITLITGGTGGLGKAVTEAFLRRGDRVIVTYNSERGRESLLAELGTVPENLTLKSVDVASPASVEELIREISREFSRLDHLVHVVGGFAGGQNVEATGLHTLDAMLTINLRSAFLVLGQVLPVMKQHNQGTIVTVASRGAIQVGAGTGAYAAAKAGLIALTQTVAAENGTGGIRANAVAPGMIDTQANRAAMPDADRSGWIAPETIAQTILFLSSADSRGVNGTVIPL